MSRLRHRTLKYRGFSFRWPGYSTIRIETDTGYIVYLDPGRLDYGVLTDETPHDAEAVLVSHTHHYDPEAIKRVATDDSVVYVLDDVVELNNLGNRTRDQLQPPSELDYDISVFEYGDEFEVGEIHVRTIPAYNYATPRGLNITPSGKGLHEPGTCVGFHLTIESTRLFWPSDSDVLDEYSSLDVDVLFAPISRLATMDRRDAVGLVETLDPDLVVPVHYKFEGKTPRAGFHITADPYAFISEVDSLGLDVRGEII